MMINRRDFLFQMGVATAGLALGFSGFQRRAQAFTRHGTLAAMSSYGFGELLPATTQNTGETFLALPRGFQYKVLGKAGSNLSDGNKTPAAHDGMACFQVGNELRLIRNHEVANGKLPKPGVAIGANPYDETTGGWNHDARHKSKNVGSDQRFREFERNINQLRRRQNALGQLDFLRRNHVGASYPYQYRRQ